ncbi:MAG TPA: DNA cytosine methyltransferase [Flavobacteriales bacterium]|nr:DNA cytosine methyltransferase [Flavobacteriales bacterium]HRN36572.1 DNA cytosine methyltransferase [Flavobacteriales bacterium]HRO41003.1 DNA cytosine methyltransferase [Flavobacteriales bacterium]HRP80548.1 DNA cytosine methyltransferase [Flavobacteriales bacterium]HRQ85247.1 DNA cytosine methyltransferase [Flavobacteriales bacterium]
MTSVEICAGAGGQSRGLEKAGFGHEALVEIDDACCATLRVNRPQWNVIQGDVASFNGRPYRGIDLLAGGVPCPPFSVAGKQLGAKDERDLFPEALRLTDEIAPRAVMLENVRGFLDPSFESYRERLFQQFRKLGYVPHIKLFHASNYGVPQLRPRVVIVATRPIDAEHFSWPEGFNFPPPTVGDTLLDLMGANGWQHAHVWAAGAQAVAPTVVGGSKKHGGPDLGPSRARKAWAQLGVNGGSIAEHAPPPDFIGMPKLTVRMVARIQGFEDDWHFTGKKTAAYRQVGNAFPPPVAEAVGKSIRKMFEMAAQRRVMVA